MRNFYPALKARMGSWDYYVAKMKMRDVAREIGFAAEMYEGRMPDAATQDDLPRGCGLVDYLAHDADRFLPSIVVVAQGGNPRFWPMVLSEDPKSEMLRSAEWEDQFGVLDFDGSQSLSVLDGRHRLQAIKTLVEQREHGVPSAPNAFATEELSVIILVRQERDDAEFLQRHRQIASCTARSARMPNPNEATESGYRDCFAAA